MKKELFDVLDENGNKTDIQKNKKEIHEQGLWHQSVHVWIFNSKGEILLQKRADNKDYWPSMWEISVAGHVSAGETPEHAVIREMRQEVGLKVSLSELKKIEIRKSEFHDINYHNREFHHVFLFKFDGNISQLNFEDKEVKKVKLISFEKLEKELNDPKLSKTYVPHGKYYFDIINAIRGELIKMIVYYHGDESLNEISLTFDDGPNPPRTEKVLDILDSFKIKVTFFLIGKWVDKFPETVKEIKRRGHLIGNQSYSHTRDTDDIEKCEETIKRITGDVPKFIRPPWGEWKNYPSLKDMKDKKIIIRSFFPIDWQNPGVDKIIDYYVENTKNGSIIIFHDGFEKVANSNRSDQMIQALPKILEKLVGKFKFVRLDEMKLIPKEVD